MWVFVNLGTTEKSLNVLRGRSSNDRQRYDEHINFKKKKSHLWDKKHWYKNDGARSSKDVYYSKLCKVEYNETFITYIKMSIAW